MAVTSAGVTQPERYNDSELSPASSTAGMKERACHCFTSSAESARISDANLLREGTRGHTGEIIADRLEFNGARLMTSVDSHYSVVKLYMLNSKAADVAYFLRSLINDMQRQTVAKSYMA